uniref:Uncharacterized protein n=1 Tax=Anguilla anguilla TaxID=7936 RepID=A0A0E9W9B5_ANGAN
MLVYIGDRNLEYSINFKIPPELLQL